MPRTYSRATHNAAQLMGQLIRLGRKERQLTIQDLADRAGISRGLVHRVEKGGLKCEMGVVFELAAIVGVPLFDANGSTMDRHIERISDKLALLPQAVRKKSIAVDDDF